MRNLRPVPALLRRSLACAAAWAGSTWYLPIRGGRRMDHREEKMEGSIIEGRGVGEQDRPGRGARRF